MKRLNYLLVFFVVFTNCLFSQLDIGGHAGLTVNNGKYVITSKWYGFPTIPDGTMRDYEMGIKSLSSFTFGGLIEAKLYSFLYFQTEVNYLDKTILPRRVAPFYHVGVDGELVWVDRVKYRFKYIEVPLLLKMKFDYEKFLPYCFAGAGIGLLYKATEILDFESLWFNFPRRETSISEFTKYEQPFVTFGVGTDYLLNDMFSIFITVRYSNSLADIAKDPQVSFKPHNYDLLLGIKTKIINY